MDSKGILIFLCVLGCIYFTSSQTLVLTRGGAVVANTFTIPARRNDLAPHQMIYLGTEANADLGVCVASHNGYPMPGKLAIAGDSLGSCYVSRIGIEYPYDVFNLMIYDPPAENNTV